MDLFLLKKVLSALIMPINLVLILGILALIYVRIQPNKSVQLFLSALLLLFVSSMPIAADYFMVKLENKYPVFIKTAKPIDHIIVLGGWHTNNQALPVTSQLNTNALQRLVETLRIYQLHPQATIITSGHHNVDKISHAEKMKQSLVLLGIPALNISTVNNPRDTEEEAQLISPRLFGKNVVLITNADHMLRAMRYFQAQGINPLPAPTGFWVKNNHSPISWRSFIPNSLSLQQTTTAWYETLGLGVQWAKGLF